MDLDSLEKVEKIENIHDNPLINVLSIVHKNWCQMIAVFETIYEFVHNVDKSGGDALIAKFDNFN